MSEQFIRFERVCNIAGLKCETDNRGYLIFRDVPIARNGVYQYYGQEIGRNSEPNRVFRVFRDSSTYMGKEIEQSLENIPITDDHPDIDVNTDNFSVLEKGHTEGKPYHKNGMVIVPKIVIKDKELQRKIQDGKREVSIGFLGHYKWGETHENCNEQIDGTEHVYRINHLAVVERGKAGPQFRFNKEQKDLNKYTDNIMDETALKNALSEFMSPMQNKLDQLADTLSLANVRLDNLENSEKEEEKKEDMSENGVVNPSMNEEHGSIQPMETGEGSGEEGAKKLVEMVYPETKKIVTCNAQVLSLINSATSIAQSVNEHMDKEYEKDEEKKKEMMHENALVSLSEAADKMKEAKNSMAQIPAGHNAFESEFSNACEEVINVSEKLEDVAISNTVSRGAGKVVRQIIRLERTANDSAPQAKEESPKSVTNSIPDDPLVKIAHPDLKKVNNSMNEVHLDFSLGDTSPFDVPSGFMPSERENIRNLNKSAPLAEVGSAILTKIANSGLGLVVRQFDLSNATEDSSFLK